MISKLPNKNVIPVYNNAGFHNSIYREKYLGNSVTASQWSAIQNGTFEDLFIGDYWTINSVNWRIAAFDYWLHTDSPEVTVHHVVIVPDTILNTAAMNSTSTTAGGYVGSDFYTGNNGNAGKATAISAVNDSFGTAHILSHKERLTNSVNSNTGKANNWAWYNSTVELMSEVMVYGVNIWNSSPGYENSISKSQLPLFRLDHSRICCNRVNWWLRSVYNNAGFCNIDGNGCATSSGSSNTFGIRPAFAIVA